MRAGILRNKAEIFTPSSAVAADGGIEGTEVSQGTFCCSVKDYTRSEKDKDGRETSFVRFRLTFRYQDGLQDIAPNSRIVLNGSKTIYVESTSVTGQRNRSIEVLCEERR